MTWHVFKFDVVFGKDKEPSGLSLIKVLGGTPVCEVLVVGVDSGRVRGSQDVMFPFFESSDNS